MESASSASSFHRLHAALAMKEDLPHRLFDYRLYKLLGKVTDLTDTTPVVKDFSDPSIAGMLASVECLIYGWGAPKVTAEALKRMPRLKAVVASQGSAWRDFTPDGLRAAAERGIVGTNVQRENAIPVAEYCLGVILLELKDFSYSERLYATRRDGIDRETAFPNAGTYGKTVGLVTANGTVARDLICLLKPFDVHVIGWSIDMDQQQADDLGIERVSLDDVFRRSDVVSIHTPSLPATRGMITAHHLSLMKDGALFLNSARGGVVDMKALEKELVSGRIRAVLDVTDPAEPLPADSPLWNLPNVILTPHIAGSMGCDLHRLGAKVVKDVTDLANGRTPALLEPNPANR